MEKSDVLERLHQAETGEAARLLRDILRANVREALYELVEEEISGLCGPRHRPKEQTPYYRSGSAESEVYLDGSRTAAKRPRVRRKTGADSSIEVYLTTWQVAQNPDAWEDAMMRAILCGVTTRGHERLHEVELKGLSKSNVSRLWQRKAATLVEELMGRDLSKEPIVALMLDAEIQRCLVHKERNIKRYLSKQHWMRLGQLFADLRKAQGSEAAVEALEKIKTFLSDKNKAARDSLEEAGEQLLTFFRLDVPATLNQTFLSTNIIENAIKNLRRHIGRVCRWRHESDHPERWIASGLKLAEKGFRKVRGYRDLHHLVEALKHKKSREATS